MNIHLTRLIKYMHGKILSKRGRGISSHIITRADRIPVTLPDNIIEEADYTARMRQEWAVFNGFKPKDNGSEWHHRQGCYGEAAIAIMSNIWPPTDWLDNRSLYAGDVGGYQVRCAASEVYTLGLNPGDHGRYILCQSHELPTIYIVGWMDIEVAYWNMPHSRESRAGGWHHISMNRNVLWPASTLPFNIELSNAV